MLADRSVEAELEAVREHAQLLRQLGAKVMVYGECGQLQVKPRLMSLFRSRRR